MVSVIDFITHRKQEKSAVNLVAEHIVTVSTCLAKKCRFPCVIKSK